MRVFKNEEKYLWGGVIMLICTIFAQLILYHNFSSELQCQNSGCWPEKIQIESIIQFFLITWGAFAGTMLSKVAEGYGFKKKS